MKPPSTPALARVARRLVSSRAAGGALSIAIAIQLSLIARDLLAARSPTGGADQPIALAHAPRGIDAHRIIAAHLFGFDPPAPSARVADALQTGVGLHLTGVVASDDPSEGAAMVGPKEGETRLVRVGKDIAPGITLEGVYANHVVVSRAGTLESLALPHEPNAVLLADAQPREGGVQSAVDPSESGEESAGSSNEQMSQKIAAATAGLSQVLTARGVFEGEDGGYRGVMLQPGSDGKLFSQLGFHPGDMITHINGMALNDPAMLSLLKSGSTVRVGVRRSGGTEEISVNTAALQGYTAAN